MRTLQTERSLVRDLKRIGARKRSAPGQNLCQCRPRDVLHDDERPVVVLARVVDLDDVRMGQPGREPGLPQEASPEFVVSCQVLGENLERDRPVEFCVSCQIDGSHAAVTEQPLDAVSTRGDGLHVQSPSPPWPLCFPFPCSRWPCPRGGGAVAMHWIRDAMSAVERTSEFCNGRGT